MRARVARRLAVIAALGTFMAAVAYAAGQRPQDRPMEQVFRRLDRDGDGKLTRDELANMPRLARLLMAGDTDRDGALSAQELQAIRARLQTRQRQTARPPADADYVQTDHRLTVDGRERTYIVQAPRESEGKLPVLFVFHGGGGQGANMAAMGFHRLVAKERFIAVYPDGWQNNWNDGRHAARIRAQIEEVDDVAFVRAIVGELDKRHQIDRSRIFATGVSNGGIFSHYLAAKASDLFAGIAPIIGGLAEPVTATFRPGHPISLLVIQGDADPLAPIGGGPIARSDRGGRVISTEEMLSKYLAHNGITGAPTIEQLPDRDPNDGTTTEVRRWPPGREGVRVEYMLVKGGGHTVPGRRLGVGSRAGLTGRTSRDFDAVQAVWDFFKSCPPRRSARPDRTERPIAVTQVVPIAIRSPETLK